MNPLAGVARGRVLCPQNPWGEVLAALGVEWRRQHGCAGGLLEVLEKRMLKIKRIYEKPAGSDGMRVLVDRLWPRGVSKNAARIDVWLKEVAPSESLRKWFGHDPARWAEFRRRYRDELRDNSQLAALLDLKGKKGNLTLLYGARDAEHNNALVLMELLEEKSRRASRP